jgi:nucleoside-diphosphate-sugar epimerase
MRGQPGLCVPSAANTPPANVRPRRGERDSSANRAEGFRNIAPEGSERPDFPPPSRLRAPPPFHALIRRRRPIASRSANGSVPATDGVPGGGRGYNFAMTTVVVTGASGNVGSAVLDALTRRPEVRDVVAIARRGPSPSSAPSPADGSTARVSAARIQWQPLDVADGGEPLLQALTGADVVIHLAWLLQPSRDEAATWRANVHGTTEVLEAAAHAGVGAVIVASSVGAYSPGPKDHAVAESWPTEGVATSSYSRQKAYVERLVDAFECRHPEIRVVRLRPGLVFQARAASEIRCYFAGPFLPGSLLAPDRLPIFPDIPGLATQLVHAEDLAQAYMEAAFREVRGAFNVAADPPLDTAAMATPLGARPGAGRARLKARPPGGPGYEPPVREAWGSRRQTRPAPRSGRCRP